MSQTVTVGKIVVTASTLRQHQSLALQAAKELLAGVTNGQTLLHRKCAENALHDQSELERHLLLTIEAMELSIARLDLVLEIASPEPAVTTTTV